MSDKPQTHRRQLRNYLIDRKVQLRFTLIMVVLTTLLTAALGVAWYAEIRKASAVVQVSAIAALGSDAAASLENELAADDQKRLLVLVGFAVALALLVVVYSIIMTHRIAGPLFKMKRYMSDIEAGRLYKLWGLRRGDQLQEFFAGFERMHGALRTRVEEDTQLLGHLIAAIERGEDMRGELSTLKQALQAKTDSLREASQNTMKLMRPTAP